MKITQFADGLIRLSSYKIGLAEAACFFAIGNGATLDWLATKIELPRTSTRIRVGILCTKKLVERKWNEDGTLCYRPTKLGTMVMNDTLGIQSK